MAKISWLSSFESGIPEIDNDHRALVEMIGKIEVALEESSLEECSDLFSEFLTQAADHFKREEAFLISIDFPRLESHSAAHRELLKMGGEVLKSAKTNLSQAKAKEHLEELIYFLLEDVIKADAEFKSYAQEKGLL